MFNDSSMYYKLFCVQADLIEQLNAITAELIKAHQQVEDMYINATDNEIVIPETQESTDK